MKKFIKLILSLFLLLFIVSCSQENSDLDAEQSLTETYTDVSNIKIKGGSIKISIGRKSRNCRGFGICAIKEVTVNVDDYTFTYNNQNRELQGGFETITPDQFNLVINDSVAQSIAFEMGDGYFTFEEDFELDEETIMFMGLTPDFTIEAGSYAMIYNLEDKLYRIELNNQIKTSQF